MVGGSPRHEELRESVAAWGRLKKITELKASFKSSWVPSVSRNHLQSPRNTCANQLSPVATGTGAKQPTRRTSWFWMNVSEVASCRQSVPLFGDFWQGKEHTVETGCSPHGGQETEVLELEVSRAHFPVTEHPVGLISSDFSGTTIS